MVQVLPVVIFVAIVSLVLIISFYFAARSRSASGYYAAGGRIHWSVNGIAFAGDYLSAASFLGICGMIATAGYDGFLGLEYEGTEAEVTGVPRSVETLKKF